MKSSEKIKVEAEGKIFHKHSHSYDEERFWLTTKRLIFAAICNKNEFLEVPIYYTMSYFENHTKERSFHSYAGTDPR
jgi:hypothetical protein